MSADKNTSPASGGSLGLAYKRAKVYIRLGLLVAAAVAITLLLIGNRNHETAVWFFWLTSPETRIPVGWLMVWSGVGALIGWYILLYSLSMWRDLRDVGRLEATRKMESEYKQRERRLSEREKRLDDKLNRSAGEGGDASDADADALL